MPIVIVGIDGGSWRVLDPLLSEGTMPNLGEAVRGGAKGVLMSTIPPVTGAAWLSMATGLYPGKTGVIDFVKHVGDLRFELVSSRDFEGRSIWDYASWHGLRVGIANYPMLYPPYPVNGFMISGLGTPGNYPSSWPPNIVEKLRSSDALWPVYVDYHREIYDDLDLFFKDVEDHMTRFARAMRILADPKLDLFVCVVQASDWVLHRLWAHIDSNHPWHNKLPRDEVTRARKWFKEFWSMVDEVIGIALDTYGGNGAILIASDHGFGPQCGVFNLLKWCLNKGYVARKPRLLRTFLSKALRLATTLKVGRFTPRDVKKRIKSARIGLTDVVDIKKSLVIVPQYTIPFGGIHVNPRYRDRASKIIERILSDLRNVERELGLSVRYWLSRETYQGDKAHLLPDVILTINEWSVVIIKSLSEPIYRNEPYSPRHTGSHRPEGVFVAYGEDIEPREIDEIRIVDIAPTVLHMLNLPIPKGMDGVVLARLFKRGSRYAREPVYIDRSHYAKLYVRWRIKLRYSA